MRLLLLCLGALAVACGDSATSTTNPTDASSADQSAGDSSAADSGSKDSAPGDSSVADTYVPYEAGALDTCNPNDPTSCTQGKKCCSEPTHKTPPSAYVCVTPTGDGVCPMLP